LAVNGCTFASVYAVRVEDAYAIQETSQTAAGFKGIVWSQRLWVDFDSYEAALEAELKLSKEGYDYVVYDTGGRGKHIGIARDAKPSHTLPQQDKAWVSANLAGADLSLYWHLHLIRLPRTIHEKTGLPKKLISRHPGRSISLPVYEEAATSSSSIEADDLRRIDQSKTSIFSCWEVINLLQPTGERKQLVELSKALQANGCTFTIARWLVNEVNLGFKVPRDFIEVDRIVRWAYNLEERD
jgi:hypothetical protein